MRRAMVLFVAAAVTLGGCRVKKERLGGRTRVEIQGENVQVSTQPKTVKVGAESTQVPVPQVHIGADSARTRDTATARAAVPPPG